MKTVFRLLAVVAGLFFAGSAAALIPGNRVDNFRLLDHTGASHELYYFSDAKAVVLMTYGNGCGIVQKSLPRLREIRDEYKDKGVEFLLIDSNLQDDRDAVAKESTEFDNDLPILIDETQLIGEALGVGRTADVFVVDPKNWTLVYRGPMDDRLSYGAQKPDAKKQYLTDALDATLAGRPAAVTHAEALVRTKRMPPWHADPNYGSFVGDRSMTNGARSAARWANSAAMRRARTQYPIRPPPGYCCSKKRASDSRCTTRRTARQRPM